MIWSIDHSHSTVTMKNKDNQFLFNQNWGINHRINKEYVDCGRIQRKFVTSNWSFFPHIRLFSYSNCVINLLWCGWCVGCQSLHLRNICTCQYSSNAILSLLTEIENTFPSIHLPLHHDTSTPPTHPSTRTSNLYTISISVYHFFNWIIFIHQSTHISGN